MKAFDALSPVNGAGLPPFASPEQQQREEADGRFAGYLPDDIEKFVVDTLVVYRTLQEEQVCPPLAPLLACRRHPRQPRGSS